MDRQNRWTHGAVEHRAKQVPFARPLVSVVIPTYRRLDLLDRCVAAVMHQRVSFAYEVLVVEDAGMSAAGMLALIRHHEQPAVITGRRLRYLRAGQPGSPAGPAAARNVGWRSAEGIIIAFTDDDTVPDPDWLASGVAAIDTGEAAAAFGLTTMPLPAVPTDYERNAAGLAGLGFITANCFVKRQALESIDGFDERYRAAWREDSDLYFTLLTAGMRVVPAPEAIVVHPIRPAPWGVSIGQQRKSQYNALLYKKYPALYRAQIQRWPPGHYYAIVISTVLAGIASVAGAGVIALFLATLAILWIMIFVWSA